MIIDAHCHFGRGDGLTGPWDTEAPIGDYVRRADAAGIAHTIVFAAFHTDYAVANAEVARLVTLRPERFSGLVFVHAARDAGRVHAMVRHHVRTHGFRGIKVHRHDAPITREVCDAAAAHGVPVLYDVTGQVAVVELLATAYPTVPFIIPHLGSFADDWAAQVSFLGFLERHPNVHTDTSGVRRHDLLETAVRRAGAHKVLFGTDGPWLHPAVELAKVHALALAPHDAQLVLAGNARRLFALQPAARDAAVRGAPLTTASPPTTGRRAPPFPAAPRGAAAAPGR